MSCDDLGSPRHSAPGIGGPKADDPHGHDGDGAAQPIGLDEPFDAAAQTYDVPMQLLQALAWVETGWQMVEGHEEHGSRPAAFGLMALRGDTLARGAALAGLTEEEVRTDPAANIEAAAALLSEIADAAGLEDRSDIGAWAEVAAEYSEIEDDLAVSLFVHRELYPTMRDGVQAYTLDGELQGELVPVDVWPSAGVVPPLPALQAGPDYDGSVWRPSPNNSSRGAGASADEAFIVIHTCEGSYGGCWSWLKNSGSGVSAHYVVNNTGSEITQLVNETRKAWHISADYACSKNDGVDCWRNGIGSNKFTIGIEHAGFANQAGWDDGLIDASARLICDISKDRGIPLDANHVFGHGQMQPWNRVDPGPNWPWAEYLALANAYCSEDGGGDGADDGGDDGGDGGAGDDGAGDDGGGDDGGGDDGAGDDGGDDGAGDDGAGDFSTLVVDSNNSNNDEELGFVSVSNQWTSSSSTSGYHGTGYWYASTSPVSDAAVFWFYLPSAGSRTLSAWWTPGGNRSAAAPFVVVNSVGAVVDTVALDQQVGGGAWNTIGEYALPAGWNRVMLSRWASGGGVVIADAIRVE